MGRPRFADVRRELISPAARPYSTKARCSLEERIFCVGT
jgi:hypothetical protein